MAMSFLTGLTGQTMAADMTEYFQNALFNPSKTLLRAEERGRVTIYDALQDTAVERALDTQFERIGHMMFVRTQDTRAADSEEIDDDC